jgi:hypothetical protein
VDQLIRMTEDARCVITGKGTVDNYPSAGVSTLCSDLQNQNGNYKWPLPIDPTAEIVQPSVTYPGKADGVGSLLRVNSFQISQYLTLAQVEPHIVWPWLFT